MLLFDAARSSGVEHGVDAIHANPHPGGPRYRISVQWRLKRPAVLARMRVAWVASRVMNLKAAEAAEFFADLRNLLGLELAADAPRLQMVQALVDIFPKEGEMHATLFDLASNYIGDTMEGGGGKKTNSHFCNAAHNSQDIRRSAFSETVAVKATPGANKGTALIHLGPLP